MSSQNTFFDLPSFVNRYMGESIVKRQFAQAKGTGDVLTLSNSNCIVYLQNFGEGVGFSFAATDSPETRFSLIEYLNAFSEGGNRRYYPKPPQGLGREELFVHDLKCYNDVLFSDALDAPLSGDFSWAPRLVSFNEESARLSKELSRLEIIDEHPESEAIWDKKLDGDLTWMDDVKRILAEQESQS